MTERLKNRLQQATDVLSQHGQQHLLAFYPELSWQKQAELLDQILSIDFALMAKLIAGTGNHANGRATVALTEPTPLPSVAWQDLTRSEQASLTEAGLDLLRRGRAAALTVAGGQGSRLGQSGPKGMVTIGLPSGKSLFQLQAERLLNLSRRINLEIPWVIMTSPLNHAATTHFFATQAYFGYPKQAIQFVPQRMLPAVDSNGRVLLSAKHAVAMVPSGNGDCFTVLGQSGVLAALQHRGVEWLFYCNVDNALIRMVDPAFLAFAAGRQADVASKVVRKRGPDEKIGMLCQHGAHPRVIEYPVLPMVSPADQADTDPRLMEYGNISVHLFHINFLRKMTTTDLPFHAAFKRISTIDAGGNPIHPSAPNAYKFERFFFDSFPFANTMAVLRVDRSEEFAPVKNRDGDDSPTTARLMVLQLHRQWLLHAGVPPELLKDFEVEISPLTSYGGEGLSLSGVLSALQSGAQTL